MPTTVAVLLAVAGLSNAQPARIEIYSIPTVTPTSQQFLTGQTNGKPVTIAGELRLPVSSATKLPAVLLVHGSGGTRANIDIWATQLNSLGVAAFLLDSFTARGIISTSEDQTQLETLAMMYDAYRALEVLAKHRSIGPNRIAIMGFSKGGTAAVYSSLVRFNKMHGVQGLTFAAHIGMYSSCSTTYLDETATTGKPIRFYHGASDDSVPVEPCRAYVQRLKAAGRDAELAEYANAWHNFDLPAPAVVDRKGPNAFACRIEEKSDGVLISKQTEKLFTYEDRCVAMQAHTGYSPNAHAASIRDVSAFLKETLKPGLATSR
jgi:dienelactone hydrolase